MRPTISEQLREMSRILGDLLPQHLDDDYARHILAMAVSNLRTLETGWLKVLPFLIWDNNAAQSLLAGLTEETDAALSSSIQQALNAPVPAPYDAEALQERNELLNGLLQEAIKQCGKITLAAIRAHLLERTAQYPMRPQHGR